MKKENGITLIALVISIIVLLILAGVTIVTLTGDNGLLTKARDAKNTSEKSAIREEIDLLLLQAKMGEKIEDLFGTDNINKDGAVYEINYKGEEILLSSTYDYIEKVEPQDKGEWNFDVNTQTLTKYNWDLTTVRGKQEVGEVIIPNYYNGKRVKKINRQLFKENNLLKK